MPLNYQKARGRSLAVFQEMEAVSSITVAALRLLESRTACG